MSGRVRLVLYAVAGVVAVALGLLFYCQWAIRQVQPFYSAALKIDRSKLEQASVEMESRVTALVSDVAEKQSWQAVFSDTEVNGWLTAVLPEKFPQLLPPSVSDLRVKFSDNVADFGFRYQEGDFVSVISLRVAAASEGDEMVAIRLLSASAGTLPIPLARIVNSITEGSRQQQLAVRWTQQEGDPVALVPISQLLSTSDVERTLEAIELHQGELFVAGSTRKTITNMQVSSGNSVLSK